MQLSDPARAVPSKAECATSFSTLLGGCSADMVRRPLGPCR